MPRREGSASPNDVPGADEDLLRRYAEGDPQAASVLVQRNLPRVFGLARRMLGDAAEAEDVAQEAMLRLWRAAPDWRAGEAQVVTWLYRVASNLCLDRLRRAGYRRTAPLGEHLDPTPSAEAILQAEARDAALQSALARLPERQRQAVVLRHLEGLSNPQIAEVMEISPRAVESLTARGKQALAGMLIERRAELGYENETD